MYGGTEDKSNMTHCESLKCIKEKCKGCLDPDHEGIQKLDHAYRGMMVVF